MFSAFGAKCIQAFLRNACPTAIAVYTRIVMRLPASKLASAAHTPLCTSLSYRADNRGQNVRWTFALPRPERSGDLEQGLFRQAQKPWQVAFHSK